MSVSGPGPMACSPDSMAQNMDPCPFDSCRGDTTGAATIKKN